MFYDVALRASGLTALLASCLTVGLMPASATSLDRSWLGIEQLAVHCQMQVDDPHSGIIADTLCDRVKAAAAAGAPFPVQVVSAGGALSLPSRTALLLVHGSVERIGSVPMLIFTIRRDREAGLEPAPILFGAAPRAAPLTETAAGQAALEGSLRASLSEILPWLRPAGTGELSPLKRERD